MCISLKYMTLKLNKFYLFFQQVGAIVFLLLHALIDQLRKVFFFYANGLQSRFTSNLNFHIGNSDVMPILSISSDLVFYYNQML